MNQNIKPTSSKTANRKKFKGNMWSVVMKKNMKKKSKRIPEKGSQKFEEMKTSLVIPNTTK